MKDINNSVRENQHKQSIRISVSIIFILIIFISSMLIFVNIKSQIKDTNDVILSINNEKTFSTIMDIKKSLEADTYLDLKEIATDIETDIKANTNLDEAEISMNNGKVPDDVQKIIEENIRGLDFIGIENDNNNIFICTKNGIVADFSIKDATKKSKERTWQYESSQQYNTNLSGNTIGSLLSESHDDFLVFEREESSNENHSYYNTISEETLKTVYMNEGISGLKNYTFLIPVYITEDGDIFGKEDVIAGHIQNNNKFILVQEYNLYDYICKNHKELINDSLNKYTDTQFLHINSYMNLLGISIFCAVICVILFLSVLSNKLYDVTRACMVAIDNDNKYRKKEIDKYYNHDEVVEIIEKSTKE